MTRRRRQLDHLQRRDLQLPRAARGARRATGSAPTLRHRGDPRGLPRAGARDCVDAAARDVRVRALGRASTTSSSARATASGSSRSTTRSSTASSTSRRRSRRCCRSCRRSRPTSRAFKDYLTFQFCLGGKTLFKGVQELLPGHFLRVRNGHGRDAALLGGLLRARLRPHGRVLRGAASRRCCDESVALHLRATCRSAPTSAAASTRASSRALARREHDGAAARLHRRFRGRRGYDESRYARDARRRSAGFELARDRHRRRTTSSSTSGDVIYHLDYPVAGPGSFPQYMVSRARREAPQGGARRPGRRRDLRRLRALPDRLLRAVHQGARSTARCDNGNFVVTYESIIPNLAALRNYKPLLQEFWRDGLFDDLDARYFRLINRAPDLGDEIDWALLGDYSPFETLPADLPRRRTSARSRTSTR